MPVVGAKLELLPESDCWVRSARQSNTGDTGNQFKFDLASALFFWLLPSRSLRLIPYFPSFTSLLIFQVHSDSLYYSLDYIHSLSSSMTRSHKATPASQKSASVAAERRESTFLGIVR